MVGVVMKKIVVNDVVECESCYFRRLMTDFQYLDTQKY